MRILLVEDNEDDVLHVRRLCAVSTDIELVGAHRLSEAKEAVGRGGIDVVLLDLTLPDSTGLVTLEHLRASAEHLPVVILTGMNEEAIGLAAVKAGAQDFLDKNQLSAPLLTRAVRYAVERQRVLDSMEELAREEERLREFYALQRMGGEGPLDVTARSFEVRPLREAAPEQFEELKKQYGSILIDALDTRVYKVEHRVGDRLRRLAEDAGRLRAGPRDIVQIHLDVLNARVQQESSGRAQAYLEEGRLLVLEFMGYLAGFYRGYFFGH